MHLIYSCAIELKNPKTATLLACALLMLNTDLHNPKVKQKMTKQQFYGIFKNAEDPPSKTYLGNLYDSIKKQELRLSGSDMFYDNELIRNPLRRKKFHTRDSINALLDGTFTYSHVVVIKNQRTHFLLRDTKLASDIEKSLLECAKHADFYVVTFSLLDEKTFDFAKLIINHIIHIAKDFSHSGKKIYEDIRKKILLVGTKSDDIKNRIISHTKATQVSLEFGISYMECSAVEYKNVRELFWRAFKDLIPSDEKGNAVEPDLQRRKPSVYI
jgi:Sec7-like guanine-nucleotide exchange factor